MADAQTVEDDIKIEDTKAGDDKLKTSDSDLEKLRLDLERSRKSGEEKDAALVKERKRGSETANKLVTETNNRLAAEETAIHNGLSAATQEAELLEQQVVAAQTEGRFAEAAKLTRQLASAQGKIDGWSARKSNMESYKANELAKAKWQAEQATKNEDPYGDLSAKTKDWISRNPEFRTNEKFRKRATAYHDLALADGLDVDTPEYFEYIDTKLSGKTVVADDVSDDSRTNQRSSKVTSATPPSRNTGGMNNGGNARTENRLTSAEAEVAVLSYPKLKPAEAQKKYLENKNILIGEGKIQGNA